MINTLFDTNKETRVRIWSIQSIEVCNKIQEGGYYRCDITKSNIADIDDYKIAYGWMAEMMLNKITKPNNQIDYPIWGWYKYDGRNKQPDLRQSGYGEKGKLYGCIELEIADANMLLSGFDEWHFILSDSYFYESDNEEGIDKEDVWFSGLSERRQQQVKEKSWERIFDVTDDNQYVQATFWEIKKDNVCNIKYFKCR